MVTPPSVAARRRRRRSLLALLSTLAALAVAMAEASSSASDAAAGARPASSDGDILFTVTQPARAVTSASVQSTLQQPVAAGRYSLPIAGE